MTQFTAAAGIKNPHLQTLLPRLIRKKALFEPLWQTLDTPDGDFLDLAGANLHTMIKPKTNPCLCCFTALKAASTALTPMV